MLEIAYCCECQEHLDKYGEVASEMFIGICNFYLVHGRPPLVCTDIHSPNNGLLEVIKFLELKSYLVSSEWGKDCLLLKPLGVMCLEEEEDYRLCHVCFEREKHA